ncbi:TPA: hypothetical protein ACGPPO_002217 [Pseudomonas aeruginosa]|uniref:hypothetical protein n=3 Tax=Pseudomonas aeruginosa TaxID=287 RepID=UPI0003BAFA54|nr:hypothetical protein [Pseudomonas aeruginosa]ERX11736.1 hypothetical protein Q012_06359 [Pseudomonas aeruginosa S35004]
MSSTQHQLIEQCATRLRGIVEALDNIHDNTPHRWSTDLDDVHSSAESLLALIKDQAPARSEASFEEWLANELEGEDGQPVPAAVCDIALARRAFNHWPKLEQPAKVGGVRFSAGVSSRLVVEAAQRLYEFESTPEKEAERIERLQAFREQLDPLNLAPHAEAFNEAPADALRPEQAEAERPEGPTEDELEAAGLGYPLHKEDAVQLWYAGFRSEVVTVLEAWEAIGHDIGMNPSKGELLDSLRNMAAICNAHGNDMPAQSAIDQRQVIADAITGALAFGAQASQPPAEDHWLRPFYDIGRAEGQRTQELAMLVRMLAASLKRHAPESNLVARATNYLAAKGLAGTPLRDPPAPVEQAGANVGHGHVLPRADGVKMRCGGPGLCSECTADASRARAALAQPSAALPPFAEKVLAKLRRFYDCASDFESGGVDIGRHWLDLLTQLGLLNRVQRSPAFWEISQQGEDLLEAPVAQAQHSVPEISGIGRDAEHPRAVVLYLRNEPSEEDMRAIQNFLRAISADVLTQAQHSVPDGWLIELGFDVLDRQFRFADAKSHLPTIKIVLPACEVDDSAAWELRNSVAARIEKLIAAAPGNSVPQAWLDVQAERRRQITAEGWTPEHDDEHADGQMARAAACYALAGSSAPNDGTAALLVSLAWPWDEQWWKPSTARRDLVKACALALAEIERLDRACISQSPQPGATTASS